ncbi:MAG: hypothetical protein LRY68_04585 [Sulfurospirillum sp.]|nr:hypothetical protein [Sulfurospirillum sp.]
MKLVLSFCLLLAIGLSWQYVSPKEWRGLVDERIAFVEELKSKGLHFGYASYWDSHIYTVFSDSEVDIRPIIISKEGIKLEHWLSNDRWYQKDSTDGKVFFITDKHNIEAFNEGIKASNMPDFIEQFNYGKYTIFIFEKNPLYEKKTAKPPKEKAYNNGSIIYM